MDCGGTHVVMLEYIGTCIKAIEERIMRISCCKFKCMDISLEMNTGLANLKVLADEQYNIIIYSDICMVHDCRYQTSSALCMDNVGDL